MMTCNLHVRKSAEHTHFFDLGVSDRARQIARESEMETAIRTSVGYLLPMCTTGRNQKKLQLDTQFPTAYLDDLG